MHHQTGPEPQGVSRRSVLKLTGMAAIGAGVAYTAVPAGQAHAAPVAGHTYPLEGAHQPGILTPAQQQMQAAAFDLTTTSRDEVISLLTDWTEAARSMMAGRQLGQASLLPDSVPDDTGETMGSGPASLTITFGFGNTFFVDAHGNDRFGVAKHLPHELTLGYGPIASSHLDPASCDGDLFIQACAEDPMVTLHAIHNLARIALGRARLRWIQAGYGRTSSTSKNQETPRNLFGFKDGTNNIKAEEPVSAHNEHLWIQPGDDAGDVFAGGSYFCFRKIKQLMQAWDELSLERQERIVGRAKDTGAPLSGGTEFTPPDFFAHAHSGALAIRKDSHVYVTHPDHNLGARMLRRGYNYIEGLDEFGQLNGGLFFIAFVRKPSRNFTPILKRMARDTMTEFLIHVGTGMFIIPPGLRKGEKFIGSRVFD
ncbi:MAG: Dyp-type peroxidase [Actinomycetaceae bacterium]|nr:Dyp-type peroxidase [Actinomycetaceae bacterium]MDU0970108.1 Dyp-type peroxidase [Actinomycetaceae bacterium]